MKKDCAWRLSLLAAFSFTTMMADMNDDPEAKELLSRFRALAHTQTYLDDTFEGQTKGARTVGPISFGPGVVAGERANDRSLLFPKTRNKECYVYYGAYIPLRGRFSIDFRVERIPHDHKRMTLFSVGTAGNTCMSVRLEWHERDALFARTFTATKREKIVLMSDPISLAQWHRLVWWYGPGGSVLIIDGAINDYSTDWSVPYAYNRSNAFYLGDQPWWSRGKPVWYPGDSFVGLLDNLKLTRWDAKTK